MSRRQKFKAAFAACAILAIILGFFGFDDSPDATQMAMCVVAWVLSVASLLIFVIGRLWRP